MKPTNFSVEHAQQTPIIPTHSVLPSILVHLVLFIQVLWQALMLTLIAIAISATVANQGMCVKLVSRDFFVPIVQSIFVLNAQQIPTMSWMLAHLWSTVFPARCTRPVNPDLEAKLTVSVTQDTLPPQLQVVTHGRATAVPPDPMLPRPIPQVVNCAPPVHILQAQTPQPPKCVCNVPMAPFLLMQDQPSAFSVPTQHGNTFDKTTITPANNVIRAPPILTMASMEV